MADINKPVFNHNVGGSNTVQFIETYNVSTLPNAIDHIIQEDEIVLRSGKEWENFYGTPRSILVEIESQEDDAGVSWDVSVKLRYPKSEAANTNIFLGLLRKPLLMKITDNNEVKKLYGTLLTPMTMLFNILEPSEVAGYNGYQIEFTTTSKEPPYELQ